MLFFMFFERTDLQKKCFLSARTSTKVICERTDLQKMIFERADFHTSDLCLMFTPSQLHP